MVRRRIDDLGNLRMDGILAWVHRLVMLITFPLRRFWLFLMICLAIFAIFLIIPLYKGVSFKEIGAWYQSISPWQEWHAIKDKAIADAGAKFEAVENTVSKISEKVKGKNSGSAPTAENEKVKLTAWPVAEVRRAQYSPKISTSQKQEVQSSASVTPQAKKAENFGAIKPPPMHSVLSGQARRVEYKRQQAEQERGQAYVPEHTVFYKGKLTDYYERLENRGLLYVHNPDILYGKADVSGPNGMSVNGTFFFLYGIYTDEYRHDIYAAERYLRNVTADAPVYCALIAYAVKSQVPTALCFVNGIFINRSMVNHNLADNVGLK